MSISSCDCMLRIFFAGSSNSTSGTRASFRYLRNPTSDGCRNSSPLPFPLDPRAVRPILWMYSRARSGGSYCMIQSTAGIYHARISTKTTELYTRCVNNRTSRPLAATSVAISIPCFALQNSKKVFVLFCCFCFP